MPLPMGAPGAAEKGGVWFGAEAWLPAKPPEAPPMGPKPAAPPGNDGEEPRPPRPPPALLSLVAEC